MAEKIQIKKDLMEKAVNDFRKASSNIETITSNIKKSTDELLGTWRGSSKEAFHDEYYVLNTNLGEYKEVLLDMANVIEKISNTFEQQDKLLGNSMK